MTAPITLQFIVDARQAEAGLRKMDRGLKEAERQSTKTGKSVEMAGKQIDVAGKKSATAQRGFQAGAKGMGTMAAAGARLTGSLKMLAGAYIGIQGARRALSTISEFETSIAQLRGVTGASGASLDRLVSTARETGAATRYSATEAAQGLLELSRAGLSVSQSTKALRPSLDLATAGMLSLAEASDLVTNVVAQFRLTVDDIEHVGDVLVQTANSSNTNVAQLGQALKGLGIVASNVGVSLEDTVAALGVLANRGLKGSDGAIKLRQAFLQLLDPSAEALRTLDSLGISMANVDIRSRGLEGVLTSLRDAHMGVVDAARLVGTRNAVALVALSESVEEYQNLAEANNKAAGSMRTVTALMDDTLTGSIKRLGSAIDDFILTAGDNGLLRFSREVVDAITAITRALGGQVDALGEASVSWASYLGQVLPYLSPALNAQRAMRAGQASRSNASDFGALDSGAPRSGAAAYQSQFAPAPRIPGARDFDIGQEWGAIGGGAGRGRGTFDAAASDQDWSYILKQRSRAERDLQATVAATPPIVKSLSDGIGQLGAAALMAAGDLREMARILLESFSHQLLSSGISSGVQGLYGAFGGGGGGSTGAGGSTGGGWGGWTPPPGGWASGNSMGGGGDTIIINGGSGDPKSIGRTVRQELADNRSRWLRRR